MAIYGRTMPFTPNLTIKRAFVLSVPYTVAAAALYECLTRRDRSHPHLTLRGRVEILSPGSARFRILVTLENGRQVSFGMVKLRAIADDRTYLSFGVSPEFPPRFENGQDIDSTEEQDPARGVPQIIYQEKAHALIELSTFITAVRLWIEDDREHMRQLVEESRLSKTDVEQLHRQQAQRRTWGDTERKIMDLRKLRDEGKARGQIPGWLQACREVGVDPDTVVRNAPELRERWDDSAY